MFNRHSWDVPFDIYPLQRKYVMTIYVSPAFRWTLRITIALIGLYTGMT
jgi:hypothetical protein